MPVARYRSESWIVLAIVVLVALPSLSSFPAVADAEDRAVATITVDTDTTYQTITAWAATAWMGQDSSPNFGNYSDEVLDMAVNELGLNRLRLEVRAGAENPEDYWTQYQEGTVDYDFWRSHRYTTINDDADPDHINWSGFQFSELDSTVEQVVLPFMQRVRANGETPLVNLDYVAFTSQNGAGLPYIHDDPDEYAEFMLAMFIHLEGNYSLVPDYLEILLEPDNVAQWNGIDIGNAIVATQAKLAAHGYNPRIIAPSNTNMVSAITYFDQMTTVTGAVEGMTELSYHRYGGVSDTNLTSLDQRRVQYGLNTSMLEHIGSGHDDLVADLTIANCSSWQQFAMAGFGPGDAGGVYMLIDETDPSDPLVTMGWRTKFLRQYFAYVRPGATRVEASSSATGVEPVAFVNPSGDNVVVIATDSPSTFFIQGLPPGTYGITYTTSSAYNVTLPDATIGTGGTIYVSIPAAGVLTVIELLRAPVIDVDPPNSGLNIYEGTETTFTVTPRNADPSDLDFVWTLDGTEVATDVVSYNYTADYGSAGDHQLTVTVTDPRVPDLSTSFTWDLTVLDLNRAPEVTGSSPDAVLVVDEELDGSVLYTVVAVDPDNDVLTYVWQVDYSEVARGTGTTYTVTYDYDSAGDHYVQVAVTDGIETVYVYWTLSIRDVNRAPTIISRDPGETVSVDEADYGYLELSVQIWDPDGDYITYEWEMDGDIQYGSTYSSYTFSYNQNSAGTYVVRVTASDGEDSAMAAWLITVVDVNLPPSITYRNPYYDPTFYENATVELSVTVEDPEGDEITYVWHVDDVVVEGQTEAMFEYIFDFEAAGEHLVNVTASDGHNTTTWSWTVYVLDTNRPPVVIGGVPGVDDSWTYEEEILRLTVQVSDPDGDELTYQWYRNESYIYWASEAFYDFASEENATGNYSVTVIIQDGRGGSTSHQWNLTVRKTPRKVHAPFPGWITVLIALAIVNSTFLIIARVAARTDKGERGGTW